MVISVLSVNPAVSSLFVAVRNMSKCPHPILDLVILNTIGLQSAGLAKDRLKTREIGADD